MVEWFQRFEAYPQSELAAKVVQGHADKTISWRHGTRLLKKRYPNSQWLILPEAGHHLVNESDRHRDTLFKWLDEVVDWPKPKE